MVDDQTAIIGLPQQFERAVLLVWLVNEDDFFCSTRRVVFCFCIGLLLLLLLMLDKGGSRSCPA
jgi:hypothetical protein